MLENLAFAIVLILSLILIGLLVIRTSLTAVRGGKILAFIAFFILPITATGFGTYIQLEHSKSTQFCLSCHVMEPYGKSLYVDDPSYVPASHFQNNRIPRDKVCFACHTDYTLFGDFNAKLRGLSHVYVYYLKGAPQKLALYRPYNNRECLHCHAGARSFEEKSPHKEMRAPLGGNEMSCLTCHNTLHNVEQLDKAKMWKGPPA